MNELLKRYLYVDPDAYYISNNGKEYAQSVHGRSYLRYNKAVMQSKMAPVPVEEIIEIIKEFLSDIGITTSENPVMNNPLSINYRKIKEQYQLEDQRDIVWLKFTQDGYLGVVATSDDINFDIPNSKDDYDKKHKVYNTYTQKYEEQWIFNTSGILVHKLNKSWDESFVVLFPLKEITHGFKRGDIEHAIGNLLIENNVPILDYYSHMY